MLLSQPTKARAHLLAIFCIMLIAAFMRLYLLPSRGLIFWDEAKFGLEGIRVQAGLESLLGIHTSSNLGKAIGSAKPTHALLIGLAYLIVGTHDYAPLFLNALASIGEVLLVYAIARRLFSPGVGLIAALFLAVSEYDILYARSALSESDSAFFLLAGFYLWLPTAAHEGRWRKRLGRRLFFAALLMGVAFTTNYRMIVYIVSIVGFDIALRIRDSTQNSQGESKEGVTGDRWRLPEADALVSWCAGLLLPMALWAGIDWVAKSRGIQLFHGDITNKDEWYLQQIPYQLHEGKQAVLHFDPVIYLQWYVAREGWLMLLLLLVGFLLVAKHRSFRWLCLAMPVLFPYLAYTFAPFIVPRNLVAALPFASILSGAALVCMSEMLPWRRVTRLVTVAVLLLSATMSGSLAWHLTSMHSGFVDAIDYVSKHGESEILTGSEVPVFYLRGSGKYCEAPAMPLNISNLSAYVQAGYRFAVLDLQHTSNVTKYIRAHGLLAAHFPAFGEVSLPDDPIASENSAPPRNSRRTDNVSVYWLPSLRLPKVAAPAARAITLCNRDSVT